VLGLQVKTDAPYRGTARWLTVVSSEDPQGTELFLTPINDAASRSRRLGEAAGSPAIAFSTDDCRRTYEELKAKAVVFVCEPKQMDYGGTDAVFEDRCGNLLNLHQD
jgi:Glyoxalase/Bleomycin resistance protein/Dioxygenase superfamily